MATARTKPKADSTITMRMATPTRQLIDSAAAALGKSRTEFMVESARAQAIDVLLDQRVFVLDAEQTKAFDEILADPPKPSRALRALMKSKPIWG